MPLIRYIAGSNHKCNGSEAGTLSGFIGRSERPSADTIYDRRRKRHVIKNWLFHVSRPLGSINASMEVEGAS